MKKEDSELSLQEYWEKFKFTIADRNRWACAGEEACVVSCGETCWKCCTQKAIRSRYCSTLRSYTNYIERLSEFVKDKPISELSLEDIKFAIGNIQSKAGGPYSEATLDTVRSVLNGLFAFAAARSDAYNIMKGLYVKRKGTVEEKHGGLLHLLHVCRDKPAAMRESIARELTKCGHKTKSLTISQLEKLTQILWEEIESDGRICLIALMLYAGIRPAEARALRWKDIVPLYDYPDIKVINVYRIRNKHGKISLYPKTDNAYRRVPVHPELAAFLKKRMEYVQQSCSGNSIDEMPICCRGNDFTRPCKDYEVALMADEIFSQIRIKQEDMYIYALEFELEKLEHHCEKLDREQQLTLYVLRRNFWTWLEALTPLTDMEKRYVMGHEMNVDNHSIRSSYNDENRLYDIYVGMSTCVISRDRHLEIITISVDSSNPVYISDAGIQKLVISEELRKKGGRLIIDATTMEIGDNISLISNCAFPTNPKVIQGEVPPQKVVPRINCSFEEWIAHERQYKRLIAAKKP